MVKLKERHFRPWKLLLAIPVALLAGIALLTTLSCGNTTSSSQDTAVGNIQIPSWASAPGTPANSAKAYAFALERPDLLSQVPCYCGCGQSAGHKSNLDCFIKSRNGDNVTFDQHGSY